MNDQGEREGGEMQDGRSVGWLVSWSVDKQKTAKVLMLHCSFLSQSIADPRCKNTTFVKNSMQKLHN